MKEKIAKYCEGTAVHLMDCSEYIQQDVRFLGATLWTDYKADISTPQDLAMYYVGKGLTDHRVIDYKSGGSARKFKTADALALHNKELNWLQKQIEKPYQGKTVVITHHGPHPVCQHPAFPASAMSAAFHSDLSGLIETNNIDVWAYGHTHANLDAIVTGTRIISNQAGYPAENVGAFNPDLIIEL